MLHKASPAQGPVPSSVVSHGEMSLHQQGPFCSLLATNPAHWATQEQARRAAEGCWACPETVPWMLSHP